MSEADDGKVLVKCFRGCSVGEILEAVGLGLSDLFPRAPSELRLRNSAKEKAELESGSSLTRIKPEAIYSYRDEAGNPLFQVLRFPGKTFRQRRPDADGGWVYKLEAVRRVLYHLADVITATHVIMVEGEKDADRVQETLRFFEKRDGVRWAATTVAGGAKGWRSEYAPYFAGKCVFILPDNDEAGGKFGQDVARSVSGVARRVKIVELPGLPTKGDVSDYLDENYAMDLQGELRKARLYKQTNSGAAGFDRNSFNLRSLRDCFDSPQEGQQSLVDGILPVAGMSVISAKPKVGKSTLARQLALDVSKGEPFLGRQTQQGEVIYFALEEKQQEVTNHFRDLGATGDEPIRIHCGSAPLAAMEEARVLLQQRRSALLVIDPLFKFARVKDGNDYAQMTLALEPILALARETETHILCVHHSGKGERTDPTDAILGSTAIFGNVDTAIMLAKCEGYRTISSSQRYGEDLPETVLDFDPDRRAVTLGAPRDKAEAEKREQQILKFLEVHPGALEADILSGIVGRRQNKVSDLRKLVGTRIVRKGEGGKRDPYRYFCSQDPDTVLGTRKRNSPKVLVSKREIVVPKTAGTSGNKNRVPNPTNGFRRPPRPVRGPNLRNWPQS